MFFKQKRELLIKLSTLAILMLLILSTTQASMAEEAGNPAAESPMQAAQSGKPAAEIAKPAAGREKPAAEIAKPAAESEGSVAASGDPATDTEEQSAMPNTGEELGSASGRNDKITISNDFISISVNAYDDEAGRFSVDTVKGDPLKPDDDDVPLIYGRPIPWTSYTTLRIGGVDYVFGGKTSRGAGQAGLRGTPVELPHIEGDSIITVWDMNGIEVAQILGFTVSSTTGYPDTARILYRVTNNTLKSERVGLRIVLDTMLGQNDGAPFRMGDESITTNRDFGREEYAEFYQAFDSLTTPAVISQGTLKGGELTSPDRMIFTNWGDLAINLWDLPLERGRDFTRRNEWELDSAVAMFWDPAPLEPGETREYITYYGLGGITIVPGKLSLGLTSPAQVTTAKDRLPTFPIIAYIQNTGEGKARDVKVNIDLPEGLKLASGAAARDVGEIMPGETVQVVWNCMPTISTERVLTYTVEVTSSNSDPNKASREIRILTPPRIVLILDNAKEFKAIGERLSPDPMKLTARVRNTGGAVAYKVSAEIRLPKELLLESGEKTWKPLGTLASGESVDVSWYVKPTENWGSFRASIIARSSSTEDAGANTAITVPDLRSKIIIDASAFKGAKPGDYISVPVLITNVANFYRIAFDIEYSTDTFQLISVSRGNLFVKEGERMTYLPWTMPDINRSEGRVRKIQGEILNPRHIPHGEVAVLNFKVVKPGEGYIEITNLAPISGDMKTIELEIKNSVLKIGED